MSSAGRRLGGDDRHHADMLILIAVLAW